jgi:IS5 family transposase
MQKRTWKKYNQELVKRGSITFFIDEKSLRPVRRRTMGRPRLYQSPLIQMLLLLKIQYRLSYRALEGFTKSILPRFYKEIQLPSYSIICRRAAELLAALPKLSSRKPLTVLIDATGIKIYGEGEWKIKVHGKSKRRKWIKIHVSMDEKTQEILALEVTNGNVSDCKVGPELVRKSPRSVRTYKADGGYDTKRMRRVIEERKAIGLIPPRKNAKRAGDQGSRDRAISEMRGLGMDVLGRSLWGKLTGYSRRSLIEGHFSRMKRMYGGEFFSRGLDRQRVEGHLKSWMLNEMKRRKI